MFVALIESSRSQSRTGRPRASSCSVGQPCWVRIIHDAAQPSRPCVSFGLFCSVLQKTFLFVTTCRAFLHWLVWQRAPPWWRSIRVPFTSGAVDLLRQERRPAHPVRVRSPAGCFLRHLHSLVCASGILLRIPMCFHFTHPCEWHLGEGIPTRCFHLHSSVRLAS